jgi:transcriptional regulator with XRE-family HTH domain
MLILRRMAKKTDIYLSARQRVAANVRRCRQQQELSQEKLAELADFHRTYVSQVERCLTNISIDSLERLAVALNVDVAALLELPPAPARKDSRR